MLFMTAVQGVATYVYTEDDNTYHFCDALIMLQRYAVWIYLQDDYMYTGDKNHQEIKTAS